MDDFQAATLSMATFGRRLLELAQEPGDAAAGLRVARRGQAGRDGDLAGREVGDDLERAGGIGDLELGGQLTGRGQRVADGLLAGRCRRRLRPAEQLLDVAAELLGQVQAQVADELVPSVCDIGHRGIGPLEHVEPSLLADGRPAGAHVVEEDDAGARIAEVSDQLGEDVGLVRVLDARDAAAGPRPRSGR